MNFSYHSNTQQSTLNLLYHAVSKITYSLKWAVDEYCWSYFHKCYITLDITMFNNSFSAEKYYECQVLLWWIFVFRHKQLATLIHFWALLKSVLIDLHAHNFVHAKTSVRAWCMHARHCARNLSSPELCHAVMDVILRIAWNFL